MGHFQVTEDDSVISQFCILRKKCFFFQLEYFDVGTPLSNKYYLGCPSGEMYGLNHVQERIKPEVIMQLRPETEVPGLYLTGECI